MQTFYTVHPGDTLHSIAGRWNIPLRSLINSNNLTSINTIYPGQQLSIPPGVNTYRVKSGDNLYVIAKYYNISPKTIAEVNGISPPYTIFPEDILTIPQGVPYYTVRPGDSLYKLALKYNVTVSGQPRPDLIQQANNISQEIYSGMKLKIPYPPINTKGLLALILYDGIDYYIRIQDTQNNNFKTLRVSNINLESKIFLSPNQKYLALVDASAIISLIDISTGKIVKLDQTISPAFINWSFDSSKIIYSTPREIRIYTLKTNLFYSIAKSSTRYPQWFSNGTDLLFEKQDSTGNSQLYRINENGSMETKLTKNNNGLLNEVRLSPNNNFILYTSPGASISEIYTIELSSRRTYAIPGGLEAKNYNPTWSKDSSRIAYSSTQFTNGKYYSFLRTSDPHGNYVHTLAVASCYVTPLVWSPNSKYVAYFSNCKEDNSANELWCIDINKQFPINLLSGYFFYNIDWS